MDLDLYISRLTLTDIAKPRRNSCPVRDAVQSLVERNSMSQDDLLDQSIWITRDTLAVQDTSISLDSSSRDQDDSVIRNDSVVPDDLFIQDATFTPPTPLSYDVPSETPTGVDLAPASEIALNSPLTTFPLLPHLPLELRRKIWQHALPEPDRMIPVLLYRPDFVLNPLLTPSHLGSPLGTIFVLAHDTNMSPSVTNIQTSFVCQEARTEYLFANPKFLITDRGGKIYYHPDHTIIRITNWGVMSYGLADSITEHFLFDLPIDGWVTEITRLAIGRLAMMNDMRHVTLMTGLKEVIPVAARCGCTKVTHPRIDFKEWLKKRKEVLEGTIARIAPDFDMPKLSVYEETKEGGEWYHSG